MRHRLLITIGKYVSVFTIIFLPLTSLAGSLVESASMLEAISGKEVIINSYFEDVWLTALEVMKNRREEFSEKIKGLDIKSFKKNIRIDKDSGLITYFATYKGKRKYVSSSLPPTFIYQVLLIQPYGDKKTRVYTRTVSFARYGENVFEDKQLARRLYFDSSGVKVLKEIQEKAGKKNEES